MNNRTINLGSASMSMVGTMREAAHFMSQASELEKEIQEAEAKEIYNSQLIFKYRQLAFLQSQLGEHELSMQTYEQAALICMEHGKTLEAAKYYAKAAVSALNTSNLRQKHRAMGYLNLALALDTASGKKLQAEDPKMHAALQVLKQELSKRINHTN